MNDDQAREYRTLCREMRACPATLAVLLENTPPIGVHYFCERDYPPDYADAHPFGEPTKDYWERFIEANKGIVAQALGGWEKWETLPDDKGCVRFFGKGYPQDSDKIEKGLEKIKQISSTVNGLLAQYQQLPVPTFQQWSLMSLGRAPYYGLVGAVCGTFYADDYDNIDVMVEQEDMFNGRLVKRYIPTIQANLHEGCYESPIDMYAVQDFVAVFAKAMKRWVPDGIETAIEEPAVPVEDGESVPAYVFKREGDVWHMRFQAIEDEHFAHSDNFDVIARLLASPDREIDGFELQGLAIGAAQKRLGKKQDGADELVVEGGSEDADQQVGTAQDALDGKTMKMVKSRIYDLEQQIDTAKENHLRIDVIEGLQEELEKWKRVRKESMVAGRSKTLGPLSDPVKAYKSVGTSKNRAIVAIGMKMPCFAKHLEGTIVPLPNTHKFVYRPGVEMHWVASWLPSTR